MNEQYSKRCSYCKETKPTDTFGRDAGAPDGIARACLACRRVISRRYAASPKGRAARAAYAARPDVIASMKEWNYQYNKKRLERQRKAAWERKAPLVAKLRKGRYNAARKLAAATDEARRQHYRKMVADHDAELARLGVMP